jgi:hypothetical protein
MRFEDLGWFEFVRPAPPDDFDTAELRRDLLRLADDRTKPGDRVGIAVGSRGIARIAEIVAIVVGTLHERGVSSVLIPAMGSHAGPPLPANWLCSTNWASTRRPLGPPWMCRCKPQ